MCFCYGNFDYDEATAWRLTSSVATAGVSFSTGKKGDRMPTGGRPFKPKKQSTICVCRF